MQTENRMGPFICDMRKRKNLTQKQLAEQLSVTDKAISKWERGMGYPDITLLTKLAECLSVTTNELLIGVHQEAEPQPEALVQYTLEYADVVTEDKTSRRLQGVGIILTLTLLTAAVICMICDLSINGRFTWVVYPVSALGFSWLVLMPLFWFRRQRRALCLLSTSVFLLPFLLILCLAMAGHWFFPLALPCALISIVFAWALYFTYTISRSGWYTASAFFLLGWLLSVGIDLIISRYTGQLQLNGWNGVEAVVCIVLAVILFAIGKLRK